VSHLTGERYTGHGYLPGPDLEDVDNAAAAARGLAEKRRPTRCDALSADERMCAQTLWAVPMF
jgi:hypothetical protein